MAGGQIFDTVHHHENHATASLVNLSTAKDLIPLSLLEKLGYVFILHKNGDKLLYSDVVRVAGNNRIREEKVSGAEMRS